MQHLICQTLLMGSVLVRPAVCALSVESEVPGVQASTNETGTKSAPAGLADPDSFPDIVARVNDTPIQKQVFLERATSVQTDMGLPEGNLPLQIYRTILTEMVDMELLYQASQSRNFRPDPEEIEQHYQSLVARFPSEEAFLKQLNSRSMTAQQFKKLMYKDLSVQKLVAAELAPRVSLREEAKVQFYNENKSKMEQPEQLRLGQILVAFEPGCSPGERERARQKIEEIRAKVLQNGTNFAAMASEFSEDTESKEKGGELLIRRGQMDASFEDSAFRLQVGAISEVIETRSGYHIIKLYERIPTRIPSYEEAESVIEEFLEQQELQSVIDAEIEKLRREGSVELFI